MALNFPPVDAGDGNPTDGMVWTAPNGRQWKYDASVPGWTSLAPTGNSNIVYRGGLNLLADPDGQYADIVSGNQFAVTTGADPVDGALYPGLGGKAVTEGAIALYDGNQWQVTTNIPYASESTAGIVELATAAEAIDETNPRVVLTPQRGAELVDDRVPQAATDVVGKTRYATKTEAEAGTETEAALTPASIQELIDRIDRLEYNIVDTGMIMWTAAQKENIPAGWIQCDGRRIYEEGETVELYRKLKTWNNPWGNSPESDVVLIPDLRGRFIRGNDDGSGNDPDNTKFGGYQPDAFASHTHGVNDPGHNHRVPGNGYNVNADQGDDRIIIDDRFSAQLDRFEENRDSLTGVSIQSTGYLETRPKNINLTPVIKL